MIRVTQRLEGDRLVVFIEGQLTADDLAVLDPLSAMSETACVLDLSGLQSADAAGSRRVRTLASEGMEIRGASPYVRLLLNDND